MIIILSNILHISKQPMEFFLSFCRPFHHFTSIQWFSRTILRIHIFCNRLYVIIFNFIFSLFNLNVTKCGRKKRNVPKCVLYEFKNNPPWHFPLNLCVCVCGGAFEWFKNIPMELYNHLKSFANTVFQVLCKNWAFSQYKLGIQTLFFNFFAYCCCSLSSFTHWMQLSFGFLNFPLFR